MMKMIKNRRGSSSILVILTFLLLMVFSVLTISSSYSDYRLALKNVEMTKEYYLLEGEAQEFFWAANNSLERDRNAEIETIKDRISQIYSDTIWDQFPEGFIVSKVFENESGSRILVVLELNNLDRSGFKLKAMKSIPKDFQYDDVIEFEDLEVIQP